MKYSFNNSTTFDMASSLTDTGIVEDIHSMSSTPRVRQVSKRQETGISSNKWTNIASSEDSKPVKLPRIIVRDVSGRILDTDTSYQKAIAEARYRISVGDCVPPEPEQWRLPNGPLPARPDYTRKCPPLLRPQWRHFQDLKRRELQLSLPDNFKVINYDLFYFLFKKKIIFKDNP